METPSRIPSQAVKPYSPPDCPAIFFQKVATLGDVIKRHLKNLLKFDMIHQISGRIDATELILVTFRTFSRTRITKINEYLLPS